MHVAVAARVSSAALTAGASTNVLCLVHRHDMYYTDAVSFLNRNINGLAVQKKKKNPPPGQGRRIYCIYCTQRMVVVGVPHLKDLIPLPYNSSTAGADVGAWRIPTYCTLLSPPQGAFLQNKSVLADCAALQSEYRIGPYRTTININNITRDNQLLLMLPGIIQAHPIHPLDSNLKGILKVRPYPHQRLFQISSRPLTNQLPFSIAVH